MNPVSEVMKMDCLAYMKSLPDKHFDLTISDPPYGIDINSSGRICKEKGRSYKEWDKTPPSKEYFDEMLRVSKNLIVFGANHFISEIPVDSKAWIVWDKAQPEGLSFAMCELALTTFTDRTAKIFRYAATKQNNEEVRVHPTQKPIALYAWILKNYANAGDVIFDPFLGSGSSRIAAYRMGFDFYATEIDDEYYDAQEKRFNEICHGEVVLKDGRVAKQLDMFDAMQGAVDGMSNDWDIKDNEITVK